jgi:alkanesulfonate monooxygenase
MVAGGFVNDLRSLDDETEHDERYERLIEYTSIMLDLLRTGDAVSFSGRWYRIDNVRLRPRLDPSLMPLITVSGSSLAGARAADQLGATAIQYPRPAGDYAGVHEVDVRDKGIRIGIIARHDPVEAWRVAWSRFPKDERGRLTHRLAMRASDSVWHRQLSILAEESTLSGNPYWLHPFENYRTFCPYLVGSHDEVARSVGEYLDLGFRTFITDIPRSPDDLENVAIVLDRARAVPAT